MAAGRRSPTSARSSTSRADMRAPLFIPAAEQARIDWRSLAREALQSVCGLALLAAGAAALASFGLTLVGLGF